MEYTVVIHPAEEGGYWCEVPALPGCYSQGETIEDTFANVKEAIALHIDSLREDNQEIPVEKGFVISKVEVKVA